MPVTDLFQEAERQLVICNACRYCEGYCAMFPAMELRRAFTSGDIAYLANLCHDCRACYYACMYAPPHTFAVNIPQVLSEVRRASYERYAWPRLLSRLFSRIPVATGVAILAMAVVAGLAYLLAGADRLLAVHRGPGAFYQVISYWAMLIPGLVAACYVIGVWIACGVRFWRDSGPLPAGFITRGALLGALSDAFALRWLRGGGSGCPYPRERASSARRLLHGLVFYGFLAAVVSTSLAAIYQDLFHRLPPFPLTSAPVVFGSLGGLAMIVGSAGLLLAKRVSDRAPASAGANNLDYAFLFTLGLGALTGMLTLVLRETRAMGTVLTIHLGTVAALFVTAPYGKFVHAVYRFLALVRNQLEQHQARHGT